MVSSFITTLLIQAIMLGCAAVDAVSIPETLPPSAPAPAPAATTTEIAIETEDVTESDSKAEVINQEAPQTQPATETKSPAVREDENPDDGLNDDLDALLDRLEASDKDLGGFIAKISYEKYDEILNRKETRIGELLYRVNPKDDNRSFAILFEKMVLAQGSRPARLRDNLKHYIFDGHWLAELDHESQPKQFIKREMVAPGEKFDPTKLGEGPIPLPIGQKKADVLRRFEVSRAQLPETGLLSKLVAEEVDGITLTPRAGLPESDDFLRIEIFYDRVTNLPAGIIVYERNGDKKTVKLTEIRRNPLFGAKDMAKLDIREPDPAQWRISIESWGGSR